MTFYVICAVTGAALLAGRFLLAWFKFGGAPTLFGGHLFHVAHDVLALVSTQAFALTCFGIAGMGVAMQPLQEPVPLLAGLFFGSLVLLFMRTLEQQAAAHTIPAQRAVGRTGTVRETIPSHKTGLGRVSVEIQKRTVEYRALTPGGELLVGAVVVVQSAAGMDTVEVVPDVDMEKEWQVFLGKT